MENTNEVLERIFTKLVESLDSISLDDVESVVQASIGISNMSLALGSVQSTIDAVRKSRVISKELEIKEKVLNAKGEHVETLVKVNLVHALNGRPSVFDDILRN